MCCKNNIQPNPLFSWGLEQARLSLPLDLTSDDWREPGCEAWAECTSPMLTSLLVDRAATVAWQIWKRKHQQLQNSFLLVLLLDAHAACSSLSTAWVR